jgi:hypothetical protein
MACAGNLLMSISTSGDNLEFRTYIEEAGTRSKELRQVIDRIVELRPHDKSIQKLDQTIDVLAVQLSATAIRAARSSVKPRGVSPVLEAALTNSFSIS